MPVQTYPLTSVSRWGAWSVLQSGTTSFQCRETSLAFKFTGTQAEILAAAFNGQVSYDGFSVSVDGGPISVVVPTVGQSWLTVASGLTDGPHTIVIGIHYGSYTNVFNWSIDGTMPVRITGANPSCAPLPNRTAPLGPFDSRTTPYTKAIVFDGDSRTYGTGNAIGDQCGLAYQGTTYPGKFYQNDLDPSWLAVNQGCYSDFASHMLARQASDVLTQFNPANTRNVLVFWGGINDLGSGTSASALWAITQQYVANARAWGVKEIILATIPYTTQTSSGAAGQIDAYNVLMKAGWQAAGATACYDANGDPAFSSHASTADWNQDGLHFSDSGYTKLTAGFFNALSNQVAQTPAITVTSVAVSPAAPTVSGGASQQFAAVVNGTGSPAQTVNWTALSGTILSGTINATGLFTAPASASVSQTIAVKATSVQDNTQFGTATVTVPAVVNTIPPALLGVITATVTVATLTVALHWPVATDASFASSSLTYNVYKDANPVPVVKGLSSPTWTDTVPADGTTHTYQASASDPAGLTSALSAPLSVQYALPGPVAPAQNPNFQDLEFEIGSPVSSLTDSTLELVAGSEGYVHIPISARNAIGIPVDLTEMVGGAYVYPVAVCATTTPQPPPSEFQPAGWVFENEVSYAVLQIGPANPLLPSNYRVYVNIAGYTLIAPALLTVVA